MLSAGDVREHVIGGLEPHTVYCVRVRAKLADGRYGNFSEVVITNRLTSGKIPMYCALHSNVKPKSSDCLIASGKSVTFWGLMLFSVNCFCMSSQNFTESIVELKILFSLLHLVIVKMAFNFERTTKDFGLTCWLVKLSYKVRAITISINCFQKISLNIFFINDKSYLIIYLFLYLNLLFKYLSYY